MTKQPPLKRIGPPRGNQNARKPDDQKRVRRNYRFPPDIIKILEEQENETEFIVKAIRMAQTVVDYSKPNYANPKKDKQS